MYTVDVVAVWVWLTTLHTKNRAVMAFFSTVAGSPAITGSFGFHGLKSILRKDIAIYTYSWITISDHPITQFLP